MSQEFREFISEIEEEARKEGPAAVAELEALREHFRLARQYAELRMKRGLTQQQLAKKTALQQSEISRLESAGGNPSFSTMQRVASALGAEVRLVAAGRLRRKPAARTARVRRKRP